MKRSLDEMVQRVYTILLERFGEPIGDAPTAPGVPDERGESVGEMCKCGGEDLRKLPDGFVQCKGCGRSWMPLDEVAPPGKEKMVKALKKQNKGKPERKKVNPWAVAWAQYNKENEADEPGKEKEAKPGMRKGDEEKIIKEKDIAEAVWIKKQYNEWTGDKRTVHILQNVGHRGPDERSEATSLCGEYEECSGSGRLGMATSPSTATCPACIAAYEEMYADEPEEAGGPVPRIPSRYH
jgi:hypothetical protein